MNASLVQLGAALLSGSVLTRTLSFLWNRLRSDPQAKASTRKLNAEADRIDWLTLRDEINRLNDTVKVQGETILRQGRCIAALQEQASERVDHVTELERDNKRLRAEVGRLRNRVQGLEKILQVGPLPPDMKAQLDELDQKTGGKKP